MKYEPTLCRCICLECNSKYFFIDSFPYLVKNNPSGKGFCKDCDKWVEVPENNICYHCHQCQGPENKNSIDLNCGEVENYVLGLA